MSPPRRARFEAPPLPPLPVILSLQQGTDNGLGGVVIATFDRAVDAGDFAGMTVRVNGVASDSDADPAAAPNQLSFTNGYGFGPGGFQWPVLCAGLPWSTADIRVTQPAAGTVIPGLGPPLP